MPDILLGDRDTTENNRYKNVPALWSLHSREGRHTDNNQRSIGFRW